MSKSVVTRTLKHTLNVSESEQSRTRYNFMFSFFANRMSRVISMKRSSTNTSKLPRVQLLTMYLKSMYAFPLGGFVDRQFE